MNRKECERVIFNKMLEIVQVLKLEIVQVLKKYDPTAEQLSLCYIDEHESREHEMIPECISFNTGVGPNEINCSAFKNAPWETANYMNGWSLRNLWEVGQ